MSSFRVAVIPVPNVWISFKLFCCCFPWTYVNGRFEMAVMKLKFVPRPSIPITIISESNTRISFKFQNILALLDYSWTMSAEPHEIAIRPSVSGIDYLWTYCMDFFQSLVVASSGPYSRTLESMFFVFFLFLTNILNFC